MTAEERIRLQEIIDEMRENSHVPGIGLLSEHLFNTFAGRLDSFRLWCDRQEREAVAR